MTLSAIMMPSRGLASARGSTLRIQLRQSRSLSSTHRPNFRQASRLTTPSRPSLPVSAFTPSHAVRYASTTATPVPQATPSPPAPTDSATSFPNLDTITLDNLDLSAAGSSVIPERIGFLSELGLNYGWGPTSCIQWALEHVHVYSGLPWWASVAVTAVSARLIMLPLFLRASDTIARQVALVPLTKPVTDRMQAAQKAGDTKTMQIEWSRLNTMRKQAGISYTTQFLPMILQAVVGFSSFKLLRAMADLPVPGLQDGGFLWLSDLTVTDGYLIMPVLMALSIHMVIRLGGETGANTNAALPPGMKKFMWYGMPGIIALFTSWMPGVVCVWFAGTGVVGIVQTLSLQRPSIRKALGIAPLYKPAPAEAQASDPWSAIFKQASGNAAERSGLSSWSSTPKPAAVSSTAPRQTRIEWQAPTLHTQPSRNVVDVVQKRPSSADRKPHPAAHPNSTSDTPAPVRRRKSIFSAVSRAWRSRAKPLMSRVMQQSDEKRKEEARNAWIRRAEEYEKRARERGK